MWSGEPALDECCSKNPVSALVTKVFSPDIFISSPIWLPSRESLINVFIRQNVSKGFLNVLSDVYADNHKPTQFYSAVIVYIHIQIYGCIYVYPIKMTSSKNSSHTRRYSKEQFQDSKLILTHHAICSFPFFLSQQYILMVFLFAIFSLLFIYLFIYLFFISYF